MPTTNRTRPILMKFFVDEHERDVIRQRMALAKTKNLSAFCRKMVMDGMIINVDYSHINELLMHVGRASTNINQIAKRINTTGRVYAQDLAEIKSQQHKINSLMREIDGKLLVND